MKLQKSSLEDHINTISSVFFCVKRERWEKTREGDGGQRKKEGIWNWLRFLINTYEEKQTGQIKMVFSFIQQFKICQQAVWLKSINTTIILQISTVDGIVYTSINTYTSNNYYVSECICFCLQAEGQNPFNPRPALMTSLSTTSLDPKISVADGCYLKSFKGLGSVRSLNDLEGLCANKGCIYLI